MQKEYQLAVDIEKKILTPSFEVNTLDLKTIRLKITITKGMTLVDLTGIAVRMSIRKPDGNVLFQDCQVVNAKGGQVEIILENQAYVLPGSYSSEIMCFKGTDKVAVTGSFSYRSIKGIMDDKAVESKSEFTAITKQLDDVQATVNDLRENGTGIDAQARQEVEQVSAKLAETANKVQWKTPQQYGAKGDGVTDDSQAFKLMLTTDLNKSIRIPSGTYIIATSEKLPLSSMIGEGKPTIKFMHKDGGFIRYKDNNPSTYVGFVNLENLLIHGNHNCDYLITVGFCSEGSVKNVHFGYAKKSVFKINYCLDIVDFNSCVASDVPSFFEIDPNAERYNSLNAVTFYGGNWWMVNDFINTSRGGNVSFIGGWFEQTDRILLKQANSDGFTVKMDNITVIESRGNAPLFTLNNTGTDKVRINKSSMSFSTTTPSIVDVPNTENGTNLVSKLIEINACTIGGTQLSNVVTCSSSITNKYVIAVSLNNNEVSFGYSWYQDIPSRITSGIVITGRGHPTTNHFLGFQLHGTEPQSAIKYDSINKYLYITDQYGINKYPIQGITERITAERPRTSIIGYHVYDKTLNKPIWHKGNGIWVDATGTVV